MRIRWKRLETAGRTVAKDRKCGAVNNMGNLSSRKKEIPVAVCGTLQGSSPMKTDPNSTVLDDKYVRRQG